jgi:arylformamidase
VPIHDISAPLRADLPAWPGEDGMTRTVVASQPNDPATVSHLAFGAHSGTHVDAPIHFLADGGGVETMEVGAFVGRCFVADLRHVTDSITGDDLEGASIPVDIVRILALTRNSGWSREDRVFNPDYVAYDLSAARWCVEDRVRLLGNDYLSIEPFDTEGHLVHKMLLGAGVAVLEGVDLVDVPPGRYDLVALPVLVPGSDGAPVRAVLIDS